MATEADFLAAVRAHPGDDTPRLVYADWLEGRGDGGDAERAEFIRVQCEIANLEGARRRPGEVPHRLLHRQAELAYGHPAATGLPVGICIGLRLVDGDVVPVDPATPFALLRRGFAERFHGPADVWLARADALRAAHPIREVTLTEMASTAETVPHQTNREVWFPGRKRFGKDAIGLRLGESILPKLLAAEWPGITFRLPPVGRVGAATQARVDASIARWAAG